MKRLMENQLTRWLQKPRRKPLVIRGARQVGKSTLVQNFTRSQGLKLAEINLEKHANLNSIFGTNDLDIIIPELELLARTHPRFLQKQQFVKHPRRSSLHYSNLSRRFRKIQP